MKHKNLNMSQNTAIQQTAVGRIFYRITNAIKIGWWAFKNPKSLQENNFKMLSGLLEMILKVAHERRPLMGNIAMVYPDGEQEEIVAIWAGAGIGSDPNKRIAELLSENATLKAELSKRVQSSCQNSIF
jgi:NAD-specific glutamate dehydrogenase